MKISAGIIIRYKDSVLLCHPTNAPRKDSFSFPKGLVEDGEDLIDAAIRECFEETGIKVSKDRIVNRFMVPYKKGRNFFKKVYLYQINIAVYVKFSCMQHSLPPLFNAGNPS